MKNPLQQSRRGPGRAAKRRMPDKIPDTVENVVGAFFSRPPGKGWRYLGGRTREKPVARGESRQDVG